MRHLTHTILAALAALSLAAGPSLAEGPSSCPPGLAKKNPPCVPPGLAKKGVTRQDTDTRQDPVRDEDYILDRFRRGDRLPSDRYVVLAEGDRVIFEGQEYLVVDTDNGTVLKRGNDWYRLPRYENSEYIRVGDSIIRVDRETKALIDLIRLTDLILG